MLGNGYVIAKRGQTRVSQPSFVDGSRKAYGKKRCLDCDIKKERKSTRRRAMVRVRVRENLLRDANGLESFKQKKSQKAYCENWEDI